MSTITFDINTITNSMIYKVVIFYIFVVEIALSQSPDKSSFFKNIIIRLITNILLINILGYDMIQSLIIGLIMTTFTFLVIDQ